MNQLPLSLSDFQKHIHDRYYHADALRGTPATFMWFMEEVGELATALQKTGANPDPNEHASNQADRKNLEEEFADVLAWLCTLANINDVDLTEAIKSKYLTGPGPQGHK